MLKTYRVVTVQKTVYVHNVDTVYVGDEGDEKVLVLRRVGQIEVCFPLQNVVSYEATT